MTVALCSDCGGAGVEERRGVILPCATCHGARLTVDVHEPAHQPAPWVRPARRAS